MLFEPYRLHFAQAHQETEQSMPEVFEATSLKRSLSHSRTCIKGLVLAMLALAARGSGPAFRAFDTEPSGVS